jgi:metallo-beta-lactamase family protein
VDRSQILLYELNNLVRDRRIPSVPVFFDSPLAEKVTGIYKESTDLFNDAAKKQIASGDDIFSFPHLTFVETQSESRGIEKFKGAKIILAGSGMSVGGRVISHEQHFLPDPKSTILLVGYQAAGSLGRELADGAKKVSIHGEQVKVNAKIETLYGYSAHKDGDHLVEFVATAGDKTSKARLKEVFVVMGEPGASMHLAQRINDELNIKAIVPERLKPYSL